MDRFELYRLLAADQLDLLQPSQKEALREELRRHPDVDAAAFAARVREALASGADLDAFVAAIADADREIAAGRGQPRRARRMARLVLVAAAAVLAVWVGGRWIGDRGDGPPATFRLDARRGADLPVLDLDALPAYVVLEVEARAPAGELAWEIRDTALHVVDRGAISALDGPPGPRTVSVTVSTSRLQPATGYWLVLTGGDGTALGQWRFDTE